MRRWTVLLAFGLGLALSGCDSATERQWMKVNEKYTTADFRRDHEACSKGGRLDDNCMRSRGWVAVSPGKVEKAPDPTTQPGYIPTR